MFQEKRDLQVLALKEYALPTVLPVAFFIFLLLVSGCAPVQYQKEAQCRVYIEDMRTKELLLVASFPPPVGKEVGVDGYGNCNRLYGLLSLMQGYLDNRSDGLFYRPILVPLSH